MKMVPIYPVNLDQILLSIKGYDKWNSLAVYRYVGPKKYQRLSLSFSQDLLMYWQQGKTGDSITPYYIDNIIQNAFGIVNIIDLYLQSGRIVLIMAIQLSVAFWPHEVNSLLLPVLQTLFSCEHWVLVQPYALAPSLCVLQDNTLTTASSSAVRKTWPFFSALWKHLSKIKRALILLGLYISQC